MCKVSETVVSLTTAGFSLRVDDAGRQFALGYRCHHSQHSLARPTARTAGHLRSQTPKVLLHPGSSWKSNWQLKGKGQSHRPDVLTTTKTYLTR